MLIPLLSARTWRVDEKGFRIEQVGQRETLTTLGNGYHAVRGSLEFAPHHGRPGSYLAGVFDLVPVHFEQLVNVPTWVDLRVRADGVPMDPATVKVREFRRVLDMRQGILFTRMRWTDHLGHTTRYESWRLVHQAKKHWALLWGQVTPENWSGQIVLAGGIDANVENITANRQVRVRHVTVQRLEKDDLGVLFEGETARTELPLALRTSLEVNGRAHRSEEQDKDCLREAFTVSARRGRPVSFTKYVAAAGLPLKAGAPGRRVRSELKALTRCGAAKAMASHVKAWARRWDAADVRIAGNPEDQAAVRFNIFHLVQCAPPAGMDVSIAAKGLHGEGYRGHVFWDTEIFMQPFFEATDPRAAREHAAEIGCEGARFPWESALGGTNVTPAWPWDIVGNRLHEKPVPHFQHHITADIAYAVDRYWRATGDDAFYFGSGIRLILECAQFWASRCTMDSRRGKYVIRGVQCVDEFHHGDNDAYTNYLASETLRLGIRAAGDIRARRPAAARKLFRELELSGKVFAQWRHIQEWMYLPLDPKTGLIEQFDGYFKLRNLRVTRDAQGWPQWPKTIRPGTISKTQIIKQADVVLAMLLLPERFSEDVKLANYRYYEARDVMGSSLSPSTYAIMGVEVDETSRAYRAFRVSAFRDLRETGDIMGVHAACLGGTWQSVVFGFGGLRVHDKTLHFKPWLPPAWRRLEFRYLWRERRLAIVITPKRLRIRVERGSPLEVIVNGQRVIADRDGTSVLL